MPNIDFDFTVSELAYCLVSFDFALLFSGLAGLNIEVVALLLITVLVHNSCQCNMYGYEYLPACCILLHDY